MIRRLFGRARGLARRAVVVAAVLALWSPTGLAQQPLTLPPALESVPSLPPTTAAAGLDTVKVFTTQTGMSAEDLNALLLDNLNAQELMNLAGGWDLGGEGTLTLVQAGAELTGLFGNGTLHGTLRGNAVSGAFTMTQDPHNGNNPSTGSVSFVIDWNSGALRGQRRIARARASFRRRARAARNGPDGRAP